MMKMKKTILKINKPFWAIVRSEDIKRYYAGKVNIQTSLIECDTATELNEILGNGSVVSCENLGDYLFKVLAVSHTNLNQIEDSEREEKEQAGVE